MRGGGTCLNAPVSHFRLKHYFKWGSLAAYVAVVSSHPELDCLLLPRTSFSVKWPIRAGSINLNVKIIDTFRVKHGMTKHAFTLAEVLVTLGIIGVVAAMTMPTLMNSTNHKELEAGFKKAYSALSQAAIYVREDLGIGLLQRYATYDGTSYPHAAEIANAFYTQMKLAGSCNYKTGSVRNFSKTTNSPYVDLGTPYPTKAVADGMCLDVRVNGGNINISVDVNGTKRPNVLGQDIFFFMIDGKDNLTPKATSRVYTEEELEEMYPGGSRPNYSSQAGNPCSLKSKQAGNGLGCAYYALIDKNPDDDTLGYWVSLK